MNKYKIKRFLLDVVYPNKCPFCNEVIAFDEYYCSDCPGKIGFLESEPEPIGNIDGTFAIFEYNETSLPFVYAIKENSDGYAVSAAAKLICNGLLEKNETFGKIDLVTCIPTDSRRMWQRGYNPPALIAEEVSAILKCECEPKLLSKIHRTEVQKSLSATERQKNLKGAFALNKKRRTASGTPLPPNILFIDDVRTTGATLSEAAGVLRSHGAEKVYAAVVAAVL